jgi:hypothetical protein
MFSRWATAVLLSLSVSLAAGQSSQPSARIGTISGIVLDDQGHTVDQASVCVSSTAKNQTATMCMVASDTEGRFQTGPFEAGNYRIYAVKESDGYADFDQRPGEQVTVSTSSPTPNVVIRMKPRAGMVLASVRDKETGKSIDRFSLAYISMGKNFNGSGGGNGGTISLTLPTGSDTILVVTADGYQSWYYSEDGKPLLRLSPGEKKTLDIELEPIKETVSN